MTGPEIQMKDENWTSNWREFPWWLVAIIGFLVLMAILVITDPEINEAFMFIIPGIWVTLRITLFAFGFALILGLLAGLGRISKNALIRNIAITYVEFVRGVPTLVLILTLAFVLVPAISDAVGIDNRDVPV